MGKVLNNSWEVLTELDIEFTYSDTIFNIRGKAIVSYRNDEIDLYRGVTTPDEIEPGAIKVWMNKVLLKDDGSTETYIFNTIYDIITETLEDEISPSKTDLTTTDFEFGPDTLPELDELLVMQAS